MGTFLKSNGYERNTRTSNLLLVRLHHPFDSQETTLKTMMMMMMMVTKKEKKHKMM